ncbi:hypothetical protein BGZ94_007269, partial [Podila epigama]
MPRDSGSNEPLLGQHNESSSDAGQLRFGLTVQDLAPLTDPTSPTNPRELGGIDTICKKLRVDPKVGLNSDEADPSSLGNTSQTKFAARSKAFGRN